jgi:multidrug efflux pump subunit AcrA (membrane-fusion protein)
MSSIENTPTEEEEDRPPRGVRTMAFVRWSLVAGMALAAIFALDQYYGWSAGETSGDSATTYYCPMHPGVQQDHPGECPICSMTLVPMPKGGGPKAAQTAKTEQATGGTPGAEGEYYCPMHPEVTSSDPDATCEKCGGMKLEPRPGATARGAGPADDALPDVVPITLSPERIQLMGMRTAQVLADTLSPEIRTVGTVSVSEKGLAVIQTRFAGWIDELKVEQTGQKVHKGQVLATVYSPELLTAQQEYLNTVKWSGGTSLGQVSSLSAGLKEDARRRLELLGISRQEIDAIEKTGQPIRAVAVRSPVAGYVVDKAAIQGLSVQPGTPLFQVADLTHVWVLADIYEYEMGRVKVGQTASIEFSAYPGEKFTGKLTFVYPSVDPGTRTLRVRLEFKNRDLKLKPGMYGSVYIELPSQMALLVPAEAVVDNGVMQYLFVARPGGTFEPRRVKLGARAGGMVEVIQGVSSGETVITTANFLLDSESHLQASILGQGATAAGAQPSGDFCDTAFDRAKFPDKYGQCIACRAHRGMGSMEDDCRNQIAKPWK